MKQFYFIIFILLTSFFTQAQEAKTKIACIGNSVTYGATLSDPVTESYPALLQKRMGNFFDVKNFGHSGATLLKKGHNPYYKTKEFAEAIHFKADIAIIHLGLNDTDPRNWPNYRDDFMPDYNWLVDTLRSTNPKMKIFVCTMTPIFTGHPRFMSSTFTWYWMIQKLIPTIAENNHAELIDLYEAFHDRPDLITDPPTLHPNKAGAKKLSEVVYQHITGDFGGLKIADIFTDNMVLQREKPISIWGTANAGTKVSVDFDHQTAFVSTGSDGKWRISFPARNASSAPERMTIENEGTRKVFGNILIGDVWLASGQSNMFFPLSAATGGKEAAANANPGQNLRLFKYAPYAETDAVAWDSAVLEKANTLDFFHGQWKLNEPSATGEFSAVAYWFGKKIQQEENIPIGIIELAVGGSPQISWLSRLTLEADPLFEPALNDWRHSDYIMQWCRQRADLNLKNTDFTYQRHPYDPAFNFEAGVAKIINFSVKGVIWYQGESDAENAELFGKLFPVFVRDWRQQWGYDFPFYYVQLSSINRPSWPYFRDMQRQMLVKVSNSGMVVTSDLGDPENVHYADKKPVGIRLADMALNHNYGRKDVVPNGPMVEAVYEKNNHIEIEFSNGTGMKTSDGKALRGFKILDPDGNIFPVAAIVKNKKVVIDLTGNRKVVKVMYGWEPFTRANLVNRAGLPASTFMMEVEKGDFSATSALPRRSLRLRK